MPLELCVSLLAITCAYGSAAPHPGTASEAAAVGYFLPGLIAQRIFPRMGTIVACHDASRQLTCKFRNSPSQRI
jgi:hypothetical protein